MTVSARGFHLEHHERHGRVWWVLRARLAFGLWGEDLVSVFLYSKTGPTNRRRPVGATAATRRCPGTRLHEPKRVRHFDVASKRATRAAADSTGPSGRHHDSCTWPTRASDEHGFFFFAVVSDATSLLLGHHILCSHGPRGKNLVSCKSYNIRPFKFIIKQQTEKLQHLNYMG